MQFRRTHAVRSEPLFMFIEEHVISGIQILSGRLIRNEN
jgi:hypothetical protein